MKRLSASLAAVMLLCCATCGPALAGEMAQAVPADAIVYVECNAEAAQGLLTIAALPPVAGMVMPEVAGPFSHVDHFLRLPAGTAGKAAPHVIGLAFALVGEEPLLLLAFDENAWPERLLQGMQRGPDGLAELGDAFAVARQNLLLLGTQDSCAAATGAGQGSLAADPAYAAACARAPDAPLRAFAAVPTLLDAMRSNMPSRERDGFDAFTWLSGLDQAQYLVASPGTGGGLPWLPTTDQASAADAGPTALPETHLTLHFANEGALLLRIIPESPIEAAAEAPADAAMALAVNWGDAAAFVNHVRDFVTQMGAVAGAPQAQDPIAQIEAALGMSLDEFAATLGSGAVVWFAAGPGTDMIGRQDWAAAMLLRDGPGFRATLDRACQNTMGTPMPAVELEGQSLMQLPRAPAFLKVTDDLLVVSGSAQNLLRYLDWRADAGRVSLLADMGERPLAALLRADLGRLLTSYPDRSSGTKVMLSLAREGTDLTLKLTAEDFSARQFYREYIHAYSMLLARMVMPALARARGEAKKAVGSANLHNIALAMFMYQQDHNKEFPASLAELVDGGYINDLGILTDPSDPNPQPIAGGRFRSSYVIVGPLPADTPPETIIAYARKAVHPDGRNVLRRDGAVMWANEWQLQQRGDPRMSLEASYDAVVAAYGDKLTPQDKARLRKFYEITD